MSAFFVYAITFDSEVFGVFATKDEAEADLAQQIADDGPAWDDCVVKRWRIKGLPEVEES